jgi:hypothetical protein
MLSAAYAGCHFHKLSVTNNFLTLSDFILNVTAECRYAGCHYAGFHYAECFGATRSGAYLYKHFEILILSIYQSYP